ncbi:putative SnoaL-like aldol condensation-catalyzing enzyme [Promicromonospora sp. AC04]|uniref:nuclear transport factor 2 family protein n=1 Tax=Promicromonospora sp. AC04 TaxID=2135723 RepID=UPI000D3951A3|nr:nuclear transport factor 2 family protein [Promicromonospora sp. AC04]PUB32168.1 putative SnoaL-like aldol condensation-catalyzing enzyme [Promicromonospora sp. AC04]
MTTESTTTDNKSIVAAAFASLVETGDVAAVERVLSDGFVHHRPDSTSSTKAEWLASMRASLEKIAGMEVEVQHVLADGDHVVMHSRRRLPSGPEIAVVDIMRFDDGLIAEAWETIEPTTEAAGHLTWWAPKER